VIGVSQSGQSPDIVAVLAEAQRQGCPTVALTNDPASPLAGAATAVIGLHTGPELAVAATKTYTASLAGLGLLSVELADDSARRAELAHLPQMMAAALELSVPALARVERYRYMEGCTVIGRGFNYATAFEVALKIKELTRTIAEPYSSADFRHGPIALVLDGFPVILIAPRGRVEADVQALAADLRQRGGELVVISDDATLLATGQLALALPEGTPEWLSPLTAVLPGQQFARLLAEARGLNVDQPVGITKVTETR
jgi:glucosamine--fructose-6-phosphate aminotransferase (isomerizing)